MFWKKKSYKPFLTDALSASYMFYTLSFPMKSSHIFFVCLNTLFDPKGKKVVSVV